MIERGRLFVSIVSLFLLIFFLFFYVQKDEEISITTCQNQLSDQQNGSGYFEEKGKICGHFREYLKGRGRLFMCFRTCGLRRELFLCKLRIQQKHDGMK